MAESSASAILDRNLALEVVRVTEASALAAARFAGRGDEKRADEAACTAMRFVLNRLTMDGVIVNGEGRTAEENMYESTFVLNRRGGFFLREGRDNDRPTGSGIYRPLAREIHLADGLFYPDRPPRSVTAPQYRDLQIYSEEMKHHFKVHLMLPRNYRNEGRPYPVCILNDGQNQWKNQGAYGGWHTDVITTQLARRGRCRDVFLVSVESTRLNRNKYYLTPPIGRADLYLGFLTDVLLPRLRSEYHLSAEPDDIAIVGASYGANSAVYAGMKRPDVFGLIGGLSCAPLKGRPIRDWMEKSPRLPFRKLYIDCGTRWAQDQKNKRTDNTSTTIDLMRIAKNKGMVEGRTLLCQVAQGHCHNEFYWRKRIGRCMEFLFSLI